MERHRPTRAAALTAALALAVCGCAPNRGTIETGTAPGTASSPRSSTALVNDGTGKTTAELFKGKFAGVEVFDAPGGGIRVKIRNSGGLNSEGGDPIYVVDGLEVSAPDGTLLLDPNNIAKIEVERVSPLYGIRGANGVIKITTKKK